jgi:NAD(P)-dependent dehydrogenase (short-subunit alcohol dehydrogenase family)
MVERHADLEGIDMVVREGRLRNKRVIVTGAAGLVGRAVVELFVREGAVVLAFDRVKWRWRRGGTVIHQVGDITRQSVCRELAAKAMTTLGGIDAVVNAVGLLDPKDGGPTETLVETWDRTMAVNVKGVWLCCAAVIPVMREQGGGSIVNVGSLVATRGSHVAQVAYTASKGALLALTRELAVHLAPSRIRVNSVSPGPLEGGVMAHNLTTDHAVERRLKNIPMGRLGRADEVAYACAYLASDEASFTTGAEIMIDGGAASVFIRPSDP